MAISLSRRLRVLAVGVIAAGALAGCSAHPGAAAVLHYTDLAGKTATVTVNEQDVSDACKELQGGQQCSKLVEQLMYAPIWEEIAHEYGITVKDADVTTLLKQVVTGQDSFSEASRSLARSQIISSKLQGLEQADLEKLDKQLSDISNSMKVQASPRYSTSRSWEIGGAEQATSGN